MGRIRRVNGLDGGLALIAETLQRTGVRYFLDSGVLLGMTRSGALNPWEKDIDLGALGDQLDALLAATPAFRGLGYRVAVNRYRGKVFSVGLKPESAAPEGALRCTVHVYYRVGDALWSPQVELYQPPPTPDVYPGRRGPVGRLLQSLSREGLRPRWRRLLRLAHRLHLADLPATTS
jgi:hypothetical protein